MTSENGRFYSGDPRINRKGTPKRTSYSSIRDYKLFTRYGIKETEYDALFQKQGGVCAICGKPETKKQAHKLGGEKVLDSLLVDHDHDTGKVRGLVCMSCNIGILRALDNKELTRKAADYLGIKVEYGI